MERETMYLFGHGMWLENETMGATTQATPYPCQQQKQHVIRNSKNRGLEQLKVTRHGIRIGQLTFIGRKSSVN